MNLVLVKPSELVNNKVVKLDIKKDPRARHIVQHLGKTAGQSIKVGVLGGSIGTAMILRCPSSNSESILQLILQFDPYYEPNNQNNNLPQITLILAVPFPKKLKALWSTISSMGVVSRVILIRSHLTDTEFLQSSSLQPHVYDPLILDGLSQGGYSTRPITVQVKVHEMMSASILRECCSDPPRITAPHNNGTHDENVMVAKILLDCGDEQSVPPPVRQAVLNQLMNSKRSLSNRTPPCAFIAIGPERGWTQNEAKLFHEMGFQSATLGRSILRVDTAVVAGIATVSAALDEFMEVHQEEESKKSQQQADKKRRKL